MRPEPKRILISSAFIAVIAGVAASLTSLALGYGFQWAVIAVGTLTAFLAASLYAVFLSRQTRSDKGHANEMSLLYQLGVLLASGKSLYETLLTLQIEIVKFIETDAFYIAIYDEKKDIVSYPVFLHAGKPQEHPSRKLNENPGLTGAVIRGLETLYIPDMLTDEVIDQFAPVDENELILHTFLGIPLIVNGKPIGALSVQSRRKNAYAPAQIQLMENVAIQAALAIDKSQLLDQLHHELIDRKIIESGLRERENILEAIAVAAEQLLKTENWRGYINVMLEKIGEAMQVTHVYIFEHHLGDDQRLFASMTYEWTAPGHETDLGNPLYQNKPVHREGVESGTDTLRRGEAFIASASMFPESEEERKASIGVKALLEMPLFVNGEWWGTIGFDDVVNERQWSVPEMDALKIAAGIISAAIQRQKAESALQESDRIYRQSIEAADAVPYYQELTNNKFLFIGEGIKELTGYSPAEINSEIWKGMIEEIVVLSAGQETNMNDAISLLRQGKLPVWKSDQRMRMRNGEIRWISDRAVPVRQPSGKDAIIGFLQDITERKLVEQNLRKRESILESITFAAEQFLKTINWRETIDKVLERLGKEFNASHAYLFEFYKDEQGAQFSSITYEWTAPGQKPDIDNPNYKNTPQKEDGFERYYAILNSGEPFVGSASFYTESERAFLGPAGIEALLEMRIVVDGKQWGTLGFDDKIHGREWTQMEVDVIRVATNVLGVAIKRQMYEETLQSELGKRTTLINELENKNEELERFTYTVSHDLKSPLVTINGFLGYLESDASSGNVERLKKDIARIQDAVNKMQRLLNELLELSRIGRLVNESQAIPFEEAVKEALEIVHGRIESRGIKIEIQPDLPVIYGDRQRIVEALQNIFDNAAKYMGDQPNPFIEIGSRGKDNGLLVLYVKDNGIGIAHEYQERIFGLFNKLDVNTEGTGVGLALVRRIIEIHGGKIWVESETKKGATFFFTLPAG